jgi:proline iminopeptidase
VRERYPPIDCNNSGHLQVSDLHSIYWEECGNGKKPVLFLHGGPGSGIDPSQRQFFDPAAYRVILFDQRGCGKSIPFSALEENTTWDLVKDIEKLRKLLGIEQWMIFGGSWGSTLALAYAEHYPERVTELIVRGIFLGRRKELLWTFQAGARKLFPDEWEKFVAPIPEEERNNLIAAYHRRLVSSDIKIRKSAAYAWSRWEAATVRLNSHPVGYPFDERHADAIARIECHYFMNDCFFKTDQWLLDHISTIRHLPGVIVQGRYDVICPVESAWELHKVWPKARLEIVANAGHASSEPGITDALIRATDEFRDA